MCSNISTDTTRSKRDALAKRFMSAVTTSTWVRPRAAAASRMNRPWGAELDTAVMRLCGYRAAIQRVSDPQPQPSSRTRWPSASSARRPQRSSMASSAASRPSAPAGHQHPLYLRFFPSTFWKNSGGTS